MKMMIKRLNLAKILAQLLVALFLSALHAGMQSVSAQTTCSSDDIDQDDDGLIEICDLEGLNDIRDNPSGAGTVGQGCSSTCTGFELTRDLDFNNDASYRDATTNQAKWARDVVGGGWQPIGTSQAPFSATFNGNDYTISNLYINRASTDFVGLFGYTTSTSNLTSVGLLNADVLGQNKVGGLVGEHGGAITKSYVTGGVFGTGMNIGGLVGNSGENSTITSSCTTAAVTAWGNRVGGLVGFNFRGTITNSCATGTVSGQRDQDRRFSWFEPRPHHKKLCEWQCFRDKEIVVLK